MLLKKYQKTGTLKFELPIDRSKSETTQMASAPSKTASSDILFTNYIKSKQHEALVKEGAKQVYNTVKVLQKDKNFKKLPEETKKEILNNEYNKLHNPAELAKSAAINADLKAKQAVISSGKEKTVGDYVERVWDIATNPLDAFTYAVKTGSVENMPWQYNRFERAGYEDPMVAGNNVAKAIDFATYFNPIGAIAHGVKDAPYTIADVYHAAQTGKLEDWKKAGESALYTALDFAPSAAVGKSGRLLKGTSGDKLKLMHLNKRLGLDNLNNYIGPRIGNLNSESINNTALGKLFPQIDPSSQLYKPKARVVYNSIVESGRAQDANQALNTIIPTSLQEKQRQIKAGYTWNEDWMNHPATQAKIEAGLDPVNLAFNRDLYLGHKPQSPILDDRYSTNTQNAGGIYDHDTKKYYINQHLDDLDVDYKNRYALVSVHEGRHAYDLDHKLLKESGAYTMLRSLLPEKARRAATTFSVARTKGRDAVNELYNKDSFLHDLGYISTPEEIASHIQELRYLFRLTPDQVVTPEIAKKMHDIIKTKQGFHINSAMMDKHVLGSWDNVPLEKRPKNWEEVPNYKNVSDAFNKLYIAVPAVGAAALMNNKNKQNTKYKMGGVLLKRP